jgi:formyltetrahydrofolate synthetase
LIRRRNIGGRRLAAPQFYGAIHVALALACLGLVACRRSDDDVPGIIVQQQITPQPAGVGPATVTVEITDATHNPIAHAAIMVEADMSHPGMSPVFAQAKEMAPGTYSAPINFNMAGDWVLMMHIKLADGRKIERQVDVKGVRSN